MCVAMQASLARASRVSCEGGFESTTSSATNLIGGQMTRASSTNSNAYNHRCVRCHRRRCCCSPVDRFVRYRIGKFAARSNLAASANTHLSANCGANHLRARVALFASDSSSSSSSSDGQCAIAMAIRDFRTDLHSPSDGETRAPPIRTALIDSCNVVFTGNLKHEHGRACWKKESSETQADRQFVCRGRP